MICKKPIIGFCSCILLFGLYYVFYLISQRFEDQWKKPIQYVIIHPSEIVTPSLEQDSPTQPNSVIDFTESVNEKRQEEEEEEIGTEVFFNETTIPEKDLVIEPSSNLEDRYGVMKSKIVRPREHRFGRIKKWEEAFNDFAKKNQQLNNKQGTVFYIKRGTTGISGQIIGICDSFFVASATGKLLQFTSSVVTESFFTFNLPHLYVPMNESSQQLAYKMKPPSFNQSWDIILTAVTDPDPLSKPIKPLKKYHDILFSTLHVTADRFFKERGNRDIMERLGVIRYKMSPAPEGRSELYNMVDVYYGRCIKSIFHPSPQIQALLDQYEEKLGNGLRIGVHIRMGNGMSDWKDSHTFLDHSKVSKFVRKLKDMITGIEAKYPELPIKVFVSTDSSTEEATMKRAFAKYIVMTEGIRSHVGGIYSTHFDELSIQKAVLDQMLLGKCDYLFLTRRSGFSRIGLYYAKEGTPFKYISHFCFNNVSFFGVILIHYTSMRYVYTYTKNSL